MKEAQSILPDTTKDLPKMEVVAQKPVEQKTKLIGSMRPQKGQICWEYNTQTKELTPAEFQITSVSFDTPKVNKRILVKDGCVYVLAINKKNALKKVIKHLLDRL